MFEVETRTVAGRPAAVGSAGPFTLVVDRPADGGGDGIGFNGGQLLCLAVAGCISNDIYREAALVGIRVDRVRVIVDGDFGGDPPVSRPIEYRVEIEGDAPTERLHELVEHVGAARARKPVWRGARGPCGRGGADLEAAEPPAVKVAAGQLGAHGHVVFGGRLPIEPGTFVERALVRNSPPERRDLRDWDEIGAWAARIALALAVESRARVDQ